MLVRFCFKFLVLTKFAARMGYAWSFGREQESEQIRLYSQTTIDTNKVHGVKSYRYCTQDGKQINSKETLYRQWSWKWQ